MLKGEGSLVQASRVGAEGSGFRAQGLKFRGGPCRGGVQGCVVLRGTEEEKRVYRGSVYGDIGMHKV